MKKIKSIRIFHQKIKSPIGNIHLYATDHQLLGLHFTKMHHAYQDQVVVDEQNSITIMAQIQLQEYIENERTRFTLPLKLQGTEFQQKTWKQLQKIPYGKTISYKELAENVGSKNAYRAVANANGKNNFPMIIPCHRVIASDRTIGGYSGGIKIKKMLLQLESKD